MYYPKVSQKIIKAFLIEDLLHLPPVSTTPVVHLELRISARISKKIETALMVYSGAWGKLIHEKKPEVENFVAFCPFKS
jgi:hypothetical protein